MNFKQKKAQLKDLLSKELIPLIGDKCILLDAPYHYNIGDLLIWGGEVRMFKENGINNISIKSCDTFNFGPIDPDVTILLNGGGNFGDVWRYFQTFKLNVIEKYPNNRIIICPQTVFYNSIEVAKNDAKLCSKHTNLYICGRDNASFLFLKQYFASNHILKMPDMAFFLEKEDLLNLSGNLKFDVIDKPLFVKRIDKESLDYKNLFFYIGKELDILDWPTFREIPQCYIRYMRLCKSVFRYRRWMHKLGFHCLEDLMTYKVDNYMKEVCLPEMIRMGVNFIAPYKHIYTTRLHVAILSIILEKPFVLLDNNYGKNSGFYDTWLSDLDKIKCMYGDK